MVRMMAPIEMIVIRHSRESGTRPTSMVAAPSEAISGCADGSGRWYGLWSCSDIDDDQPDHDRADEQQPDGDGQHQSQPDVRVRGLLVKHGELVSRWSVDISREPGRRGRLNVRKGWGGYGCEPSSRGVLGRANIPDIDALCVLASLGSGPVVICGIADHSRPAQGDALRLGHHGDIDRPSR